MSRPAIEVSGLGKRYVIEHESRHDNLRDTLHHTARKLWRRFRWGTSFTKEEFWALRDVSFDVKRGEVLGIIGRNGAGKSTLLKILSRITEPTTGRVRIRGRVASLLEVGTGFHPELTGRENIFLNGAILGMSRAEIRSKFDEIVAFAEVEKFIDTPVKHYSSGMYVRLAFAVAAHLEPEILIIDEVLAVGDAQFQKKCLGKISDVAGRDGRTVLFVSHNMTAVRSLCPRALLLQAGRLAADGISDAIARTYLHTAEKTHWATTWVGPAKAPGDERVHMRRVEIVPESAPDLAQVTIASPLRVEVEYWNTVPGAVLNVSLVLNTDDDVCVLNTFSPAAPAIEGLQRATCLIPGHFLNDGSYSVRLLLVADGSRVLLDLDRVLTFELHDVPRPGNWYGKWLGVVRPPLPWSVQSLGSENLAE